MAIGFSDTPKINEQKQGWQRCNCPKCHENGKRSDSLAVRVEQTSVQFKCHRCGHDGFHIVGDGKSGTFEKPIKVEKVHHDYSPDHENYLRSRGILLAASQAGVKSGEVYGRSPALIFPYRNGWSKAFDTSSNDRTWSQDKPKGSRLPLWNLDRALGDEIIITEGEWDCLSAIEAGFKNSVSLPEGAIQPGDTKSPQEHAKLSCITDYWDELKGVKSVILALDNDAPGIATQQALIEIFGRWRCRVVEYPKHPRGSGAKGHCKDLNEVLKLFGVDHVARLLREAKHLKLEGVFKPVDIAKPPKREYLSLGMGYELDMTLKLFRGGMSVLTGITNHGKTNFMLDMLGRLVEDHGLKVALGTFEAEYWDDIVPWYGDWLFPGNSKPDDWEERTHQWLNEYFVIISHEVEPLGKPASIEWFLQQAQDAKGRHEIDVLVLDPWNKVQHQRAPGESETDYIGRALSQVRNFAKVHNIITIVTAHPTKEAISGTEVRMPNMAQIHGSMNWGNMADHIIVVFRPDTSQTTTCISVQKVRFQPRSGRPGLTWMVCENNRYRVLEKHRWPQLEQ